MIAVDTNILVYAHRPEFPFHTAAREAMAELAGGSQSWGIVLHCLVEFAGAVSHPRHFRQPSSPTQIRKQIDAWLECPRSVLLEEGPSVLIHFLDLVDAGAVAGPKVHDARIAATCLATGVTELWTCDRDYSRFPELRVRNPFVGNT